MNLKPIDLDIMVAVARRWTDEDLRWVHEQLDKPERQIERRMDRLIDAGYLECGVSTRTAWLTSKGHAAILGYTEEERAQLRLRSLGGPEGLRGLMDDLDRDKHNRFGGAPEHESGA